MIAAWMAYALVIASLVSVAALIAERIAILRRRQSRWIWVAALLLSLWHCRCCSRGMVRDQASGLRALVALAAQGRPPVYEQSPIAWVGGDSPIVTRRIPLDTWLLAGWSALSAIALATLSMGWMQLRRRLRSAVDGERGRRERHGYARHRAGCDRHRAPANRDSTMAATARCSDTADRARARAGTRASAGHSRARRRAAGCGAASMEPADLVAADETALCDGSGLRCSRAARRAIAVDLLGRSLERRDAPGSVAGRCRRSVRVRLVAREAHSHHARAAAHTLAAAGCIPWNVQRRARSQSRRTLQRRPCRL